MLDGLTEADIRRMPPFPFPERLFPAGTFPSGMRFSADFKLPPSVEELLEQSGPEALHALAAAAGNSTRCGAAFERNTSGGSDSATDSDSNGWHTDEDASDTDDCIGSLNKYVNCTAAHQGTLRPNGFALFAETNTALESYQAALARGQARLAGFPESLAQASTRDKGLATLPPHRLAPHPGAAGLKLRGQAT